MAVGKEIKSRIKTVKNTGKITKAMELISTVKMKKAQESVLSLRNFALATLSILQKISHNDEIFTKYTTINATTQKELIVLIASQKWLCGGYNVNAFKKVIEYTKTLEESKWENFSDIDYITIGKRAREFVLRTSQNLVADFSDNITDPVDMQESKMVVRFIMDAWNSWKYQKISVVYNHYISAISQLPVVKSIFPFEQQSIVEFLHRIAWDEYIDDSSVQSMEIEPDPQTVLDYAIPMIMDAMIHETLLEARASEHAARMVAMKNAKDAAHKKASSLTLVYNKARQWAITTEITEIVSGVESMKE